MRTINQAALHLIKTSEGFRSSPYKDANGLPTIGYGNRFYEDATPVSMDDPEIDEVRGEELLADMLNSDFCPRIEKLLIVPVTDNQFGALTCLAYNIGMGNFKNSTVLKCTNCRHWSDAAQSFALWNKARGIVLPGLITRRAAEAALYLKGLYIA